MALSAILEAIKARLPTDLPLTFDTSTDGVVLQGRPRRIMVDFDGIQDSFAGPGGAGRVGEQRSLWSCTTVVPFALWGKDTDDCELMRQRFVSTIHDVCHGSYRLVSGAWRTGGMSAKGATYILAVAFEVPILRDAEATTVIQSFDPSTTTIVTDPEEL